MLKRLFCFLILLFCLTVNCLAQITSESFHGAPRSETAAITLDFGASFNALKRILPSLQKSYDDRCVIETFYAGYDSGTRKFISILYTAAYFINPLNGLYAVEYSVESENYTPMDDAFSELEAEFNEYYGKASYTKNGDAISAFWKDANSVTVAILKFQVVGEHRMFAITWQSPLPEHRSLIIN